jgi:ATP-dependent RNA helicase RhlE
MGFIHDVKKVIVRLPEKRQTLFFSATMPPEIQKLANVLLTNPAKVEVTPVSSTVDAIEQSLYYVGKEDKNKLLLYLLKDDAMVNALVFTRTKHGADKVVKVLQKEEITAAAIHGNKSQNARQNALTSFKNGKIRVLVATDIAARGIDIDDLGHVINFELPEVPETYVHRIGRTGRAGNTGIAISFCDADEKIELRDIQKLIGKTIPQVGGHPYVLSPNAQPQASPVKPHQRPNFKSRGNNFNSQGRGGGGRSYSGGRGGERK